MIKMKQIYSASFIALSSIILLSAGCSSNQSNQNSSADTAQSTTNCESNRQAITAYLKGEDAKDNSAKEKGNRLTTTRGLQEIFYSPKIKACAYYFVSERTFSSGPNSKAYNLKKFPGNEILTYQINITSGTTSQAKIDQFNKDLKTYK